MLAMPVEEVNRLATRTQDLIETLVSGRDSLAHGRRTCPELAPLAEALSPTSRAPPERTAPRGAPPNGTRGPLPTPATYARPCSLT